MHVATAFRREASAVTATVPSSRRALALWFSAILAYLLLRSLLILSPGYPNDLQLYEDWALDSARYGLRGIYATTDYDYPPLYAYMLYGVGRLHQALSPEVLYRPDASSLLALLVRLPPLLFDVGVAVLLWAFARRTMEPTEGLRWRRMFVPWQTLLPALYLLNPAVLLNTGYWGQPDSIHSLFVLAAFYSLSARPGQGAVRGWVLWTLACLMKPLAAPFAPLLLALSLAWHGVKSTAAGLAAAALTALVAAAPFVSHGGIGLLKRFVTDLDSMSYASVNAHNAWGLVASWREANDPWLGPLTPTQIGLVLFGSFPLALLWRGQRLHRSQPGGIHAPQALALALGVAFGFFMLSTHMHENHLFIALPLLLTILPIAGPARRGLFALAIALTVGISLNLLLHDPLIQQRWHFDLAQSSTVWSEHLERYYGTVELWAIRLSTVWNVLTFGVFAHWLLRRDAGGLLESLRTEG